MRFSFRKYSRLCVVCVVVNHSKIGSFLRFAFQRSERPQIFDVNFQTRGKTGKVRLSFVR